MPVFVCPTDSRAGQAQFAPRNGYLVAFTSYLGVSGMDLRRTTASCFAIPAFAWATSLTGPATRCLPANGRRGRFSIRLVVRRPRAGYPVPGTCSLASGVNVQTENDGSCPPGRYPYGPGDFSNQCDMFHFWSLHPGGEHFLLADGTVRFIEYSAAS